MSGRTWVARRTARRRAEAAAIVRSLRPKAIARDGHCRAAAWGLGPCRGPSEMAHLGPWKRHATRGQAPARRHVIEGVAMLCDGHHDRYDGSAGPRFEIESVDGCWAQGRLRAVLADGTVVHEERIGPRTFVVK